MSAPLSYTQLSDDANKGFSTYKIHIYDSKSDDVKRVIWIFDSGQEVILMEYQDIVISRLKL